MIKHDEIFLDVYALAWSATCLNNTIYFALMEENDSETLIRTQTRLK